MSVILEYTSGKCIKSFGFFNLINNFYAVLVIYRFHPSHRLPKCLHIIGSLEALWVIKIENSGKFSDKMQMGEASITNQRDGFYFKLGETTHKVNTV